LDRRQAAKRMITAHIHWVKVNAMSKEGGCRTGKKSTIKKTVDDNVPPVFKRRKKRHGRERVKKLTEFHGCIGRTEGGEVFSWTEDGGGTGLSKGQRGRRSHNAQRRKMQMRVR